MQYIPLPMSDKGELESKELLLESKLDRPEELEKSESKLEEELPLEAESELESLPHNQPIL